MCHGSWNWFLIHWLKSESKVKCVSDAENSFSIDRLKR